MKKILSLLSAFAILICMCACQGNFGDVNLKKPIAIPDNGIIEENIIKQLKNENAIGIFTGTSGDFSYEWTFFGSDITDAKALNLNVQLSKAENGDIVVALSQEDAFGFPGLLSVYLNEQWNTQNATAYTGDKAIASVSVTGSKTTILNLSLDGSVREFRIHPAPPPEELIEPTGPQDGVKDQYNTDPVPAGKPQPVEPENQAVNKGKAYTCTFSIECSTILNNLSMLDPEKLEMVPSGGVILATTRVTFYEGESVFDVLQRLCREKGIHIESEWTPIYNSAYIEGIHNLYEFDCGALSGWMYCVNDWYPNYGCSRYQLKDGDVVRWRYTCDLGNDVGGGYAVGG